MKIARTLGVAGTVLGATFGFAVNSVQAADISEASPSWTGPYLGANFGYGWDSGRVDMAPRVLPENDIPDLDQALQDLVDAGAFPESLSPKAEGILGGGQAGYNWEMPSGFVVGVEADLQASDIEGSKSVTLSPEFFDQSETGAEKKVDWFGTVRARAGYLVTPQWLLYATGGLAYGKTSLGFDETDVQGCGFMTLCGSGTSSGVKLGWTLGAGAEVMLASNWSLKGEYLYVDLGKRSFDVDMDELPIVFDVSAVYHEQIIRAGLNYHFN